MFSHSHMVRLAFGAIICVLGMGWIASQNGISSDQLLGVVLAGLLVLAFGYASMATRPSASLSSVPPIPRAILIPGANSDALRSMRDADTAPSPIVGKQMRSIHAPELQMALREWIGARSISEPELRELLSAMSEVILVLDTEGRHLRIAPTNPAFLYRPSEVLIGKTLHEVYPQHQADFFLGHIRRALETHERVSFEYSLPIGADEFWFATTVSPLTENSVLWVARDVTPSRNAEKWRWIEATGTNHLDDPSVKGIVVNYRDITEQKEREEEIQRRNLELGVLFQIGQALSRLAPLSEILETVYAAMGQALDHRNLYIALYDESKGEIHFPIYTIAGERRPPFGRIFGNGITEYILRTKEPLFIPRDVDRGLQERGIKLIGAPACCFLGVPLLSGGKTIGVMAIQDYEREDAYSASDVELFSTIASQVASAIENARLYDEAHNRAEEFRALYQTTHAFSLSNDLPTLLQSVVANAAALLNVPAGGILLYNAERNVLEISAVVGLPIPVASPMGLDEGFASYVFRTGKAIAIENYSQGEHRSPQFEKFHLGAMIGVPLIYRGEAMGVLQLGEMGNSTRTFTEADEQLLTLFAGQIAGAVHSARLLAESRKRADEFAALYETTKDLSSLHDLPRLLQIIVDRAASLLGTTGGGLYLYDSDRNDLWVAVAKGLEVRIGTRLELGEGMAGKVAQSRQPLFVDDYRTWEGRSQKFEGIPFKAVIEVPMLYGGELIGVLTVHSNTETSRKFTEQDARLLSLFASQAAGAVRTARLLAETQKRANQLALLNAITSAASGTLNLREMLQSLADQMGKLFGADGAYITLWDEDRKLTIPTAAYGPFREFYPQQEPKRDQQTMTRSVLNAGHALVAEDASNSSYVSPTISACYPARSIMGLPLIAGDKKLGAVIVGFNEPHWFTAEEISFGEQAAGQIALAVAKTQLLEEIQKRADEFAALHQITRDLNSYKVLPELLQTILERATELFRASSGSITLYNSARGNLELAAAREFPVPIGTTLNLGVGMAGIVAQKREPLIVDDYSGWEYRTPHLEGFPVCASICVPMIYRGELIGTLGVRVLGDPSRKFTDADAGLLSLFASQAANAVHNARLFEETNTRADQMAMLYDAGLMLNRVLDPKLQLEFLVELAAKTLKAERAVFYRYDPTQYRIQVEMAVGYDPEILERIQNLQYSVNGESSIPGWVLQNSLAVNLADVKADSRYASIDPNVRSGLWVPIEHESVPRGVLCIFSTRENAFTTQDERLLTLYANQVSTAMGNAELFGEINQRLVELEAISKLSTALRAARTRNEMLPLFLKQTLALFETDAGVIWLYDPIKGVMEQATASGWFSNIREMSVGPGEGIAGHVFATGELHISREFVNDPLTRKTTVPQIPASWAGACVPIRSAEKIVGVLFVAVPLPRQMNQQQARLLTTLAEIAGNTLHRMHLHESLEETFVQTIAALAHAIDARDTYTAGHSNNVAEMAVELAAQVGLAREEQEAIRLGGLLHDIGKIAIPDAILHKPSRLTPEEYALVKTHPKVGAQILEPIKQLRDVVPIVLYHQERFDGTGYPGGLARDEIPIGARILSVVDAFSSITDDRSYRPARSRAEALIEIEEWAGRQFDPQVVKAFRNLIKEDL